MDFDAIILSLILCDVNADQLSVLLTYYLRSTLDQIKLDWDNLIKYRNFHPSVRKFKGFFDMPTFCF